MGMRTREFRRSSDTQEDKKGRVKNRCKDMKVGSIEICESGSWGLSRESGKEGYRDMFKTQ